MTLRVRDQKIWQRGALVSCCQMREQAYLGASLIELLVYIVLLSLLSLLLFQGALMVQNRVRSVDKKSVVRIGMYAALDALTRDVRSAPASLEAWLILEPSRLSWRTQKSEIAWYAAHGSLYRAQKTYNVRTKKWGDSVVSLVAQGIAAISFQPLLQTEDTSQVAAVFVRLASDTRESLEGMIAVRARELR